MDDDELGRRVGEIQSALDVVWRLKQQEPAWRPSPRGTEEELYDAFGQWPRQEDRYRAFLREYDAAWLRLRTLVGDLRAPTATEGHREAP